MPRDTSGTTRSAGAGGGGLVDAYATLGDALGDALTASSIDRAMRNYMYTPTATLTQAAYTWSDLANPYLDNPFISTELTTPTATEEEDMAYTYFTINDTSNTHYYITLHNWINPKSGSHIHYNFTVPKERCGNLEAVENYLNTIRQYVRKYVGNMVTAEDSIRLGTYAVSKETKEPYKVALNDLNALKKDLTVLQERYNEATSRYYHVFSAEFNPAASNAAILADELRRAQDNHIRAVHVEQTLAAISKLDDGSIPYVDLEAARGTVQWIHHKINNESGVGSLSKEAKFQFNYTAMRKRKTSDRSQVDIYSDFVNRHSSLLAYCLRITKAQTQLVKRDTEVNLNLLYPSLKRELRRAQIFATEYNIVVTNGHISNANFGRIRDSFIHFNNIKNKLMLLGFQELEVSNFLATTIYKSSVGLCDITKQWIPTPFLADVRTLDGIIIKGNIHYLTRSDGRERSMKYKVSNNLEHNYFLEKLLRDDQYYSYGVGHYRSKSTEYLSVKSMQDENVKVYGKNTPYRPIPYLGIELEVERNSGCVENVSELVYDSLGRDYIICKTDGSLGGHLPFEIVTVPATLRFHQDRWKGFLEDTKLKQNLTSYASGKCGMHVHISRDSFNGLHLAKFMRFINNHENTNFMTDLAQRNNDRMSGYKNDTMMGHAKKINGGQKYQAVNCANPDTIEVRIFRGNLAKVSFLRNLEFVQAAWCFTKDASIAELSYKDFLYWIFDTNNDTKDYKHLKLWLASKQYNVSNVVIKKSLPASTQAKLQDKGAKIKKMQLSIVRKYKPTEPTFKLGSTTPVAREELLASA